jgi:hypothetical protein
MSFSHVCIDNELEFYMYLCEVKKLINNIYDGCDYLINDIITSAEAHNKKVGEYDISCLKYCGEKFDKLQLMKVINFINQYKQINIKPFEYKKIQISDDINNKCFILTYKNMKLKINKNRYYIMHKRYTYKPKMFNLFCFCLLLKYKSIQVDKNNNMCASIDLDLNINKNTELFGSAFNTSSIKYCSMFYYIEQYFGSMGNFFSLKISPGIYNVNPPFNHLLIYDTIQKLEQHLQYNNSIFNIFLPDWSYSEKRNKYITYLLNSSFLKTYFYTDGQYYVGDPTTYHKTFLCNSIQFILSH